MQQIFKNLGLNPKETEAFLKLLELGAQPASVIARHVGIPRSTMYLVLESLKTARLVEEFDRAQIKYFRCIPARKIGEVIKARERKLESTLQMLEDELPELEKLENKMSITPKIRFFEGKEAVMKMYDEVFFETEFCAIFNPELAKDLVPAPYDQIPKMLRQNGGRARELVTIGPEGRNYQKKNDSEFHRIKLLPPEIALASDTIICGDRIYFVSYGDSQISATEIYSPSIVTSQKTLFEYLWQSSK